MFLALAVDSPILCIFPRSCNGGTSKKKDHRGMNQATRARLVRWQTPQAQCKYFYVLPQSRPISGSIWVYFLLNRCK